MQKENNIHYSGGVSGNSSFPAGAMKRGLGKASERELEGKVTKIRQSIQVTRDLLGAVETANENRSRRGRQAFSLGRNASRV